MPLKIFVSYRRQDTAASAVGIGQYLEKEFGNKNVYIDVETHAGAKYASVIEKRLAECRVLLVLIGPNWLKLQKPNDWVQREITYALKRDITVIPVLIDGAQLPDQELLPDDIKGLVDHQAASVSIAGFRHEMAGLVKDIRSIGSPKPWRLLGAIAAILILSVTAGIFVYGFGLHNLLDRTRLPTASPEATNAQPTPAVTNAGWTNGIWKSSFGEWVMYGVDNAAVPVAYFFSPSSIKSFGDRVAFLARYPLRSNASVASEQKTVQEGAYEDELTVLDCKKSVFAIAESTIYDIAGKIIFHLKSGEPESLDLSNGQPVSPTAMLAISEHIVCDEQLRTIALSKAARFGNMHLSYLANAPDGDGSLFYGPMKPTSNPTYPIEVLSVLKRNNDHLFEVIKAQNVRGLPPGYRTLAGNVEINCAEKKVLTPVDEYYDKDDHLIFLSAAPAPAPAYPPEGAPFRLLLNITCDSSGSNVAGNYEGMNYISYGNKGEAEQKVSINIQLKGSDLKISFQTANGASGEGTGKLTGNRAESISLHSTTPGCPGSYAGPLSFADNSVSWSYKGEDCAGPMEGHGTAPKVTQ
jgi:hypothetical protein